jgi:hypothetical protein
VPDYRTAKKKIPIEDRLFECREITPDGHWLWLGGTVCPGGHGRIRYKNKIWTVHRLAYTLWIGLPKGLVCHKQECNIKTCFNPEHLYDGDNFTNARDKSVLLTHCPHGHAYTPENSYVDPSGRRSCRTCRARRDEEQRRLGPVSGRSSLGG